MELSEKKDGENVRTNMVTKLSKKLMAEMSREELEMRVTRLELHNEQLRNLLIKSESQSKRFTLRSKKSKPFDFSKHCCRHILLRFVYLGWDRCGFTVQESTLNTVEAELFNALTRSKMIENRENSNYHRCGRTDKGVSAFSQVVSLTVRSRLKGGKAVILPKESDGVAMETKEDTVSMEMQELDGKLVNMREDNVKLEDEFDYATILNSILPHDIRILGWASVDQSYSARFDCTSRTYKYFFPKGDLNIRVMHDAAQYLVGSYDFRNLCKMDVGNGVVSFTRRIDAASISLAKDDTTNKNKEDSIMKNSSKNIILKNYCLLSNDSGMADIEMAPDQCNDTILNSRDTQENIKKKCTGMLDDTTMSNTEIGHDRHDDSVYKTKDNREKKLKTDMGMLNQGNFFTEKSNNSNKLNILSVDSDKSAEDGYEMCVCTIKGKAFLWHQIRAIMTLLILIGQGKESPEVIRELLDVEKCPRKPQYGLADEVGLNLYETEYENIKWYFTDKNLRIVMSQIQALWTRCSIKSSMIRHMLGHISSIVTRDEPDWVPIMSETCLNEIPTNQASSLIVEPNMKVYLPLLKRPKCASLEHRVERFVKRGRIDPNILNENKK